MEDAIAASAGIGNGIETFPLYDYVMQSVFLKMTGFQEQKMKCICWDLATIDYEYRYDRFTKKTLGECSSYEEKKIVYKDLVDQIKKRKANFNILTELNKQIILTSTIAGIRNTFSGTNLSIWAQNRFNEFVSSNKIIEASHFVTSVKKGSDETKLFENVLQQKYEVLYKHRNRCAHNTFSYQQNLPTLKTLESPEYKNENYFIYFSILVLIDKIFLELYGTYLKILEDN